jgi:hypothetical protein
MISWEVFQIWLMAFLTLALFSFQFLDNPVYKVAEHIFAGLTAGYQVGLVWEAVVQQTLIFPIFEQGAYWRIIPGILGLLMLTRLVPKVSWISRTSLAFVMAVIAGIFLISQLHGLVLPQMQNTMVPQITDDAANYILTAIVVVGVISTLIYFYFSHEHTGVLGVTAKVGIWFIMIAFGAHFGYTVMGRLSLLIGRVQFLIVDWIGTFT